MYRSKVYDNIMKKSVTMIIINFSLSIFNCFLPTCERILHLPMRSKHFAILATVFASAFDVSAFSPVSFRIKISNGETTDLTHIDVGHASVRSFSTSTVMNAEKGDWSEATGLERGKYLFALVFLVNIWLFSVPVEYRRAKFCTEQQVMDSDSDKCMTWNTWKGGIADYYRSGGGFNLDFSIDPDSK